jgi:hypothetical protein
VIHVLAFYINFSGIFEKDHRRQQDHLVLSRTMIFYITVCSIKGIVSRDFGPLLLILFDRYEVRNRA